jgi:hypothetical protein
MPWHNIEATLHAAAPGTRAGVRRSDLSAAAG